MYKELTPSDIRAMLKVPKDYQVDALLTFGSHPKSKVYPSFEEALTELEVTTTYEPVQHTFFSDIKSLVTAHGRLWFDVIYGCAYASEIAHVASLLGAKTIIHLGTFGALQSDIQPGDILIPKKAYGNESATRMYAREQTSPFFSADEKLHAEISNAIGSQTRADSVISIQAMLAETSEDVTKWQKEGYAGVEMECATLFAVAEHFGVPAGAALCAGDNLATNTLATSDAYAESQQQRKASQHLLYIAALKTVFARMERQ